MSTNLWAKVSTLSFKAKATLLSVGLGITPIVMIGTICYVQVYTAAKQQTIKTQKAKAIAVADKLNRFIFERNGDIEILSSLPVLADAKISTIASVENKTTLLNQFISSYRIYDSIAVFNLKGEVIAQSTGDKLSNHSDRQYFKDTLTTGKTVISHPELSKSSSKMVLHFAAPIRDTITRQIIGVVRTRAPIDRIAETLNDLTSKSENYYIVDRQNNQIFISSNKEYISQPETPEILQARTTNTIVAHQSRGMTANDGTKIPERIELLSTAPFKKLEGMTELPWTAIVSIDEVTAYAELQGLLLTILAGAGLTAVSTVAFAAFFTDRITKYIQQTISTISNSANEIVDTVQSQETTVFQQANSTIETTNTIDELGNISNETAIQAAASATGAKQALFLAEAGTQSVQKTIEGMSGLRDSINEIATQIVHLGEQTGEITNVSDLVSNLAKQTNMLALKAAVEAARVGEQGKGFGVVAGEIRKLAEESKKSAQKINNLATDIQSSINQTVSVTVRGTKTVTEGIKLAENTAATFIGVTDAIDRVFLNSEQISASAKQQAIAIQQALSAMTIVSQGSQENAIGMHKVKTSTRELNQIADDLQAVVGG